MMISKRTVRSSFFAATSLLVSTNVFAAPFTLDFEGVADSTPILDFYNGGTDLFGNSGTNFGVSFGSNALGLVDRDAGGNGNFANEPTPDTSMFFLSGSAVLNYAPGFDTGFSFFYTTAFDATVTVWDDLDATGSILGTLDLITNSVANNCSGDPQGGPGDALGQFCNWDIASLGFSDVARSIDFSGTVNQVGFDNITFGSVNPATVVPVPAAVWLFGSGLLGLVGVSRRNYI